MNVNEPDAPKPPAADPSGVEAAPLADVPAKPRRRRVAKPEVDAASTPAGTAVGDVAAAAEPAAIEATEVAVKPAKPARRKRVAPPGDAPAMAQPDTQAAVEQPGPPAVAAAEAGIAAEPALARPAPATVEGADAPGLPATLDPAGAPPAAETGDAVPTESEAGAPREAGRRSRNRRRNRGERGGERGERPPRVEGAEGAQGTGTDDDSAQEGADAAIDLPSLVDADPAELFAHVLSGDFDQDPAGEQGVAPVPEVPKRVLAAEPDAPKLHKVLAQAGIGSRRDMEQWVLEGRVTVNGEPAHIGQRISFGDRIAVAGKPVKVRIAPPPPRVLAYHKPAGEVVSHDDPQHRPTVFRRLPRLPHGKWQSVGRLDINTEGLLLFTNSGDLANQLMHPRFGVEREYAVRSLGVLEPEQHARLLEGVEIDGQRAGFKSITDGGGEGVNHWYRVVITEGRNREVRKLFEAVGHAVSRLIRIRYGCVVLPRGLKRGVWVDLPEGDVRALRRLTGTERPRDAEGDAGGRGKRGRRGGKSRDPRPREAGPERAPDRGRERGPRPDRSARADGEGPMNIPNPLQQTYDKRAIQQARSTRRELSEDDPIPNPLQQTYDRRALQRDRMPQRDLPEDGPIPNPLQQTYDKRFVQKTGGGGGGGSGRGARTGGRGPGAGGGQRQPDPLQTAVGYIGADAFRNKGGKGGGRGGNRGGPKGGPGGGGGGGGNRGGGGGGRGGGRKR